ncbi:hypothetical protein ACFQ0D_37485, partial [Micromonospora zhanjiangensis]
TGSPGNASTGDASTWQGRDRQGRDRQGRDRQGRRTLADAPTPPDALDDAVAPFLDRSAGETAEQHLVPLVRRGLVRRGTDYALTDTGRTLFDTLAGEVRVTRELTTAGLTADDYRRTVASLETMIRNLERG